MDEIFTTIYQELRWPAGKDETKSGIGSTLRYTKNVTTLINQIIETRKIRTILDLGCGEMNWQQHLDLTNIKEYYGIDIVSSVVDDDRQKFKHDSRFYFDLGDITRLEIPAYDLIICREVLFHLSIENIQKVLDNIRRSHCKYLLVTSHENTSNVDIQDGNFFEFNITAPPFDWKAPLEKVQEDHRTHRYIYLYSLDLQYQEDSIKR